MRALERRIAGVCRAVAVKVLESKTSKEQKAMSLKEGEKAPHRQEDREDQAAIVHPPEMPIVIDEVALEDILGVNVIERNQCSDS